MHKFAHNILEIYVNIKPATILLAFKVSGSYKHESMCIYPCSLIFFNICL